MSSTFPHPEHSTNNFLETLGGAKQISRGFSGRTYSTNPEEIRFLLLMLVVLSNRIDRSKLPAENSTRREETGFSRRTKTASRFSLYCSRIQNKVYSYRRSFSHRSCHTKQRITDISCKNQQCIRY